MDLRGHLRYNLLVVLGLKLLAYALLVVEGFVWVYLELDFSLGWPLHIFASDAVEHCTFQTFSSWWSEIRVHLEHLRQDFDDSGVEVLELLLKFNLMAPWVAKVLKVVLSTLRIDEGKVLFACLTELPQNDVHLVPLTDDVGIFCICSARSVGRQREARITLEQNLTAHLLSFGWLAFDWHNIHELVKSAAQAPNVWGLIVLLFNDRHFRSSVPSRADVRRKTSLFVLCFLLNRFYLLGNRLLNGVLVVFRGVILHYLVPNSLGVAASLPEKALREWSWDSKITYFHLRLLVNKNVLRLQVSVDNVGWVDKLKAAEEVVEDQDQVGLWEVAALAHGYERLKIGFDVFHHNENMFLFLVLEAN